MPAWAGGVWGAWSWEGGLLTLACPGLGRARGLVSGPHDGGRWRLAASAQGTLGFPAQGLLPPHYLFNHLFMILEEPREKRNCRGLG